MTVSLDQVFAPLRPASAKDVVAETIVDGRRAQILGDALPPPNADHSQNTASGNARLHAAQGYDNTVSVKHRTETVHRHSNSKAAHKHQHQDAARVQQRTSEYAVIENLAGSNSHAEVESGRLHERGLTAHDMRVDNVTRPLARGYRDTESYQYVHTRDGGVSSAPPVQGRPTPSKRVEQLHKNLRNTAGPIANAVLDRDVAMPVSKREAQCSRKGTFDRETTGSYSVALQTLKKRAQATARVTGGNVQDTRPAMRPIKQTRNNRRNKPAQLIAQSGGPARQPLIGQAAASHTQLGMGTTLPLPSSQAMLFKGPLGEQERQWSVESTPAHRLNAESRPFAASLRNSVPDREVQAEERRWGAVPHTSSQGIAGPLTPAVSARPVAAELPFQPIPSRKQLSNWQSAVQRIVGSGHVQQTGQPFGCRAATRSSTRS